MAVFMEPILYLLGADEHTMLYAKQYSYCVIVFGGVPTVLSNVLSNLLRSAGASKEAGFGITFGGLINIALDPLFMFVLMPRGCEVLGAGIATCISNFIACFYFAFVIFRMGKDSVVTFSLKGGGEGFRRHLQSQRRNAFAAQHTLDLRRGRSRGADDLSFRP